ncbi:MAG TPA: HEPN domain-containing protein [Candidatus Kapabacteria bacterium]|nr:HEPN domain-containing protein [Candidatus Kapabacteria bacterium]
MTSETSNWWKKSEGDYRTMRREAIADPPNYDAVCFHAQQCIEKLLKAVLIEHNIPPPYTHNLPLLADLLESKSLQALMKDLELLSLYAVGIRYPLEFASKMEAEEAIEVCIRIRKILLSNLGIPDLFE